MNRKLVGLFILSLTVAAAAGVGFVVLNQPSVQEQYTQIQLLSVAQNGTYQADKAASKLKRIADFHQEFPSDIRISAMVGETIAELADTDATLDDFIELYPLAHATLNQLESRAYADEDMRDLFDHFIDNSPSISPRNRVDALNILPHIYESVKGHGSMLPVLATFIQLDPDPQWQTLVIKAAHSLDLEINDKIAVPFAEKLVEATRKPISFQTTAWPGNNYASLEQVPGPKVVYFIRDGFGSRTYIRLADAARHLDSQLVFVTGFAPDTSRAFYKPLTERKVPLFTLKDRFLDGLPPNLDNIVLYLDAENRLVSYDTGYKLTRGLLNQSLGHGQGAPATTQNRRL